MTPLTQIIKTLQSLMLLRLRSRYVGACTLCVAMISGSVLPATGQVSVTSELSSGSVTSLQSTDGRTGVTMRVEFGSEGAIAIQPSPGHRDEIESSPALRDLMYHRAEIAVRRGRVSELEAVLTQLQARADFDIDYRFKRRAFALPTHLNSVPDRRRFVLTSVIPYLFPSMSGRVFSCGRIVISRPAVLEAGRLCLSNTSVKVADPYMYFDEPGNAAEVPAYFVAWERQGQSNGRPFGEITTSLEWDTPYTLVRYPDADSLFIAPVADAAHTLLAAAAASGNIEILNVLVDSGASVDAASTDGRTALHVATAENVPTSVEWLLDAGASVDWPDNTGRTPLHVAADMGFDDLVSALVSSGGAVDRKSSDGQTPLLLAVGGGHDAVVRILLDAGTDPEVADAMNVSPLMHAASAATRGIAPATRVSIVSRLIAEKVDVNRTDPDGQSALHYATLPDDADVVRALVTAGALVDARTSDGTTALMLAAEAGHRNTLRVLADAGATIEATDARGNTPLMRAAAADASRTLEDLLRRGANKRARNMDGLHALGIAKSKGSGSVRRVFEHIKPIQFSYIKLGANLARLTDPQHASSVGGELGVSLAVKMLTRLRIQIDGGSVIRVTDPEEDGPVSFGAPGDFYYAIYTLEVRPQLRFALGNPYRRHPYVLAGAGFGSLVEAELRDYSGQTDEEVVTDNTDQSFTSLNLGLGYEVDLSRSIVTLEVTYSRISSMKVDRFEGAFDTFGFSLGLGF